MMLVITIQFSKKHLMCFFIFFFIFIFLFWILWHTYIIKVIEQLEVLNVYLAIFLLNRQKEEKYISKIITFLNKNKNIYKK